MYEMDEAWMAYYEELEPEGRLKLLDGLPDLGDEALGFCRMLYEQRYTDPKHPDRKADTWLWKFVYLPGLYKRQWFLTGALKKEMRGTIKELHLEHPDELSELQKAMLFHEFRNAAKRYLSTCSGDHYASQLLGMKKATDQEKLDRACEDVWIVSRGIAHAAGMEENFKLWADALYEALLAYDPAARRHYEELEAGISH